MSMDNEFEWNIGDLAKHTQKQIRHYSKGATLRLLVDVVDEDIDCEIASNTDRSNSVIDSDASLLRIGSYLAIRRILVDAAANAKVNPIEIKERI